jgi:hypothetical protein
VLERPGEREDNAHDGRNALEAHCADGVVRQSVKN